MIRTLTKQGNSLVFIVERPIRELLNITEETPLQVTVEGGKLIIQPISDEEREKRFVRAMAETNRVYGKDLKNLASK